MTGGFAAQDWPGRDRVEALPAVDPEASTSLGLQIDSVHSVLRAIPSHGWTAGWIGRCDRALIVLSQMAGLGPAEIAGLSASDITVVDGIATITTPTGVSRMERDDDDLLCGPCALARWLHALDMTVSHTSICVIASVIARAAPITPDSPHICEGRLLFTDRASRATLMPAEDRWGDVALAATTFTRPVRMGGGDRPRVSTVPQQRNARSQVVRAGALMPRPIGGSRPEPPESHRERMINDHEYRTAELQERIQRLLGREVWVGQA